MGLTRLKFISGPEKLSCKLMCIHFIPWCYLNWGGGGGGVSRDFDSNPGFLTKCPGIGPL